MLHDLFERVNKMLPCFQDLRLIRTNCIKTCPQTLLSDCDFRKYRPMESRTLVRRINTFIFLISTFIVQFELK
jgi:hypothetical protein